GKRAVSADTALRLGRFLGTSPEFWLNLQAAYDLRTTRARTGSRIEREVIPMPRAGREAEAEGRLPHRSREEPAWDAHEPLECRRRRLRHDPQHRHREHEPPRVDEGQPDGGVAPEPRLDPGHREEERHLRQDAHDAFILQVDMPEGSGPEDDRRLGDLVTDAVPGAVFASGRAIREAIVQVGDRILAITSSIAFAALALACFGVGNVVAANIGARRFEYGVLRATGATPALLVRLVLAEVVLLTLAGAIVGTGLGLHLARMGVLWHQDLGGQEIGFRPPVGPIAIGWAVLLVMTVASAAPAVRALARRSIRELVA
ncbi:MAG: HigA family addiction module antitoxin, partial [Phycisphaerales bacterium]